MAANLGSIRFIIDENQLWLDPIMRRLRPDVACFGRPPIEDTLNLSLSDPEWIPTVASYGWVVLTNDRHMRTRPHEAPLALEYGLKVVNSEGVGHQSAWDQLVRLLKHWETIEQVVTNYPDGPWWLQLRKTDTDWQDYKPH